MRIILMALILGSFASCAKKKPASETAGAQDFDVQQNCFTKLMLTGDENSPSLTFVNGACGGGFKALNKIATAPVFLSSEGKRLALKVKVTGTKVLGIDSDEKEILIGKTRETDSGIEIEMADKTNFRLMLTEQGSEASEWKFGTAPSEASEEIWIEKAGS